MTRVIASFLYVGYLRPGPGTWGSLAALPFGYLIHVAGGFPLLVLATVVVFGLGWWAVGVETAGKDDHDPSWIVVDEVAGQWVALWPLSFGMWYMAQDPWVFPWPGWVGAFLMFRLFDIWKPGPVGWADRQSGPMGVMLDDVIAGVLAALVVMAAAAVAHGVLMA
ncbi:phosphatidylglycerophosphatase A [Halodurantibacterium flavum]|uniref:Phosphatidylglycerophosphatase A n=1 Tax=Halodurantibacterium flavum TaxID=1382802 RepID=A0ABW4S9G8_9RHOB